MPSRRALRRHRILPFHKVSPFRLFLTVILLKKDTIQSYLRYFDRSASPQAFASSFFLLLPSPNDQATSPHPSLPPSPIQSHPAMDPMHQKLHIDFRYQISIYTDHSNREPSRRLPFCQQLFESAAAGSRASDSCSLEVSTKHREPHTRTHARQNDTDSITLNLAFSTGRAFYILSDGVPVFSLLFVNHQGCGDSSTASSVRRTQQLSSAKVWPTELKTESIHNASRIHNRTSSTAAQPTSRWPSMKVIQRKSTPGKIHWPIPSLRMKHCPRPSCVIPRYQ